MNLRLKPWLRHILASAIVAALGYIFSSVVTYQWRENQSHDALAAEYGITKAMEAAHYTELKNLETDHHDETTKRLDRMEDKEDRIYDIISGHRR